MPGLHIDKVGVESEESHYKSPVNDLDELYNLPVEELENKERRFVISENTDYFFDAITRTWKRDSKDNNLITIKIPLSEVNLTETSTDEEVEIAVGAWIAANADDKLDIDTVSWEVFQDGIILTIWNDSLFWDDTLIWNE